jgi:hypothetical protein
MNVNLTRKATLTIADQKTISDHPELHHYTTEDGLRGIFKTNTIWATHFLDLNDTTEVKLLREPLVRALSSRFQKLVRERQHGSLRVRRKVSALGGAQKVATSLASSLVESLYKVTFAGARAFDFGAPFIASFCSHSNEVYERECESAPSQDPGAGSA